MRVNPDTALFFRRFASILLWNLTRRNCPTLFCFPLLLVVLLGKQRRGTRVLCLTKPPTFAPLTGAVSRRSSFDAQAQRSEQAEGGRAISCTRREVLGCLGAVHVPDDGASVLKVWGSRMLSSNGRRWTLLFLILQNKHCTGVNCVRPTKGVIPQPSSELGVLPECR